MSGLIPPSRQGKRAACGRARACLLMSRLATAYAVNNAPEEVFPVHQRGFFMYKNFEGGLSPAEVIQRDAERNKIRNRQGHVDEDAVRRQGVSDEKLVYSSFHDPIMLYASYWEPTEDDPLGLELLKRLDEGRDLPEVPKRFKHRAAPSNFIDVHCWTEESIRGYAAARHFKHPILSCNLEEFVGEAGANWHDSSQWEPCEDLKTEIEHLLRGWLVYDQRGNIVRNVRNFRSEHSRRIREPVGLSAGRRSAETTVFESSMGGDLRLPPGEDLLDRILRAGRRRGARQVRPLRSSEPNRVAPGRRFSREVVADLFRDPHGPRRTTSGPFLDLARRRTSPSSERQAQIESDRLMALRIQSEEESGSLVSGEQQEGGGDSVSEISGDVASSRREREHEEDPRRSDEDHEDHVFSTPEEDAVEEASAWAATWSSTRVAEQLHGLSFSSEEDPRTEVTRIEEADLTHQTTRQASRRGGADVDEEDTFQMVPHVDVEGGTDFPTGHDHVVFQRDGTLEAQIQTDEEYARALQRAFDDEEGNHREEERLRDTQETHQDISSSASGLVQGGTSEAPTSPAVHGVRHRDESSSSSPRPAEDQSSLLYAAQESWHANPARVDAPEDPVSRVPPLTSSTPKAAGTSTTQDPRFPPGTISPAAARQAFIERAIRGRGSAASSTSVGRSRSASRAGRVGTAPPDLAGPALLPPGFFDDSVVAAGAQRDTPERETTLRGGGNAGRAHQTSSAGDQTQISRSDDSSNRTSMIAATGLLRPGGLNQLISIFVMSLGIVGVGLVACAITIVLRTKGKCCTNNSGRKGN
ncbi:unnamed protein product [Amoebophrya sp. A25]|nr:unnamed protein product [Amoebophrya sp. A25]|eukprot:GSA25T00026185001.1